MVGTTYGFLAFGGEHIPVAHSPVIAARDALLLAEVEETGVNRVSMTNVLHEFVVGLGSVEYHFVLVEGGGQDVFVIERCCDTGD